MLRNRCQHLRPLQLCLSLVLRMLRLLRIESRQSTQLHQRRRVLSLRLQALLLPVDHGVCLPVHNLWKGWQRILQDL